MIRFITPFLFLISINTLFAQRWLQGAGSFGRDELNGLSISSSNAIFSTGTYAEQSSFDAFILAPFGNGDVFIARQDLNGSYTWVKRAGGLGIDKGNCITVASNNNIAVGGTFTQNGQVGSFQATLQGSQDGFICQLNENGDFTWLQTIGGTGWKNIRSITSDALGNLFVAGEFSGEAILGGNTFTSALNPETLEPSKDIFLAKLSSTGTFLWAKQGSADFDDQVFNIAADNLGNCYLTGKYSDTLSFISNHPNTIYNAGFVMKVDGQGEEIWFKKITGSQLSLQGLVFKNNELILGGSFAGNLTIQGTPNTFITNTFSKKCFLAKLNSSGDISWTSSYGSDNAISLNALDIDNTGDIYVGGTFRCGLTGFRTPETTRLWETVGFRDIYVAKFSNLNGERLWAQQYAGQKEDVVNAIKTIGIDDVVMGGFTRNGLSIPKPDNYILHASNRPPSLTSNNGFSFGCLNEETGIYEYDSTYFSHLATTPRGENDIFISRPVALNRPLIDQFGFYGGNCGIREMPLFHISLEFYNQYNVQEYQSLRNEYSLGPDTIAVCGLNQLNYPYSTAGYSNFLREYSKNWSNSNITDEVSSNFNATNGWTYLELIFEDGCPSLEDSVYQIIDFQVPEFPSITSPDITLYNVQPANTNSLYYGFYLPQDTITLTAAPVLQNGIGNWYSSNFGSNSELLQNGYSFTFNNLLDTINFVHQYNGGSCKGNRLANIYPFLDYASDAQGNFLDSLNLGIFINNSVTEDGLYKQIGDTIVICDGPNIGSIIYLQLADSTLWENETEHFIFSRIRWTRLIAGLNPQPITNIFPIDTFLIGGLISTSFSSFSILQAGQVTIQAEILIPPNDSVYRTISRTFYVKRVNVPNDFSVETPFTDLCLGDTLFAIPSFADSIVVDGPNNSFEWPNFQPIPISEPGTYFFRGYNIDSVYGCRSSNVDQEYFSQKNLFPINSLPQNGIICPGETVSIIAEDGSDRYWIGPIGDTLGTGISIAVNTPGLYRYIQTDADGCRRSSEFIEIELKTIPYLQAEKNVICPGELLEIEIIADATTTIQWLPPLLGNQLNKVISNPGIYKAVSLSCGINDTVSLPITLSTPVAEITAPNGLSFCPSTGIPLFANTGNYEFTWLPTFENGPIIINNTHGSIILEAYNEYGCIARDTVITTELNALTPPVISQSGLICNGDSVQLSVNQNLSVSWLDFPNGNIIDSTNTLMLIAQENSIIYCKANESAESCESETIEYQVLLKPLLNIPEIMKDSIICFGETLSLQALEDSSIAAYQWIGPNNISFNGSSWIVEDVDNQFSGNYRLYLIPNPSFCPVDSLEFEIQIQPNPTPSILSLTNTVCEGSNILLSTPSTQLSNIYWKIPDGTEVQSPDLNLISITQNDSGWYQLFENLNGCIANDSLYLTVNEPPGAPVIFETGGKCINDIVQLNFQNWQLGDTLQILSPDGFLTSISESVVSIEIIENNSGIYTFNLLRGSCKSTEINFTLNSPTVINSSIEDQYTSCIEDFFQINSLASPINSISEINWINPQGNIIVGQNLQISSTNFVDSGMYTLQIIDFDGCKTEFLFHLQVNNCNISGIPNSFTPNADGMNDSWIWNIPKATELSVYIFNRWGAEVAILNGDKINWNGLTNKGMLLPSNTYYYIINYKNNGKKEEINGFVEIKY